VVALRLPQQAAGQQPPGRLAQPDKVTVAAVLLTDSLTPLAVVVARVPQAVMERAQQVAAGATAQPHQLLVHLLPMQEAAAAALGARKEGLPVLVVLVAAAMVPTAAARGRLVRLIQAAVVAVAALQQIKMAIQAALVSSLFATPTLLRLLLQQQAHLQSPCLAALEFINGPHQGASHSNGTLCRTRSEQHRPARHRCPQRA
jgi:hypothetical protein